MIRNYKKWVSTKFLMTINNYFIQCLLAELSYYQNCRKDSSKSKVRNCQHAPYAYRHIQNFTTDVPEFSRQVENAELSGNVDSPESGMDALMQAIVCKGILPYLAVQQNKWFNSL